MSAPRYLVEMGLAVGARGQLDEGQARHFNRVMRRTAGDQLVLFNGSGVEATAIAVEAGAKAVTFEVQAVESPEREPSLRLSVGLALLKASAFELAVQKLTEIGVARITPLEAERSVVTYRSVRDWERRAARIERIIVEAAEQSERVTIPELTIPISLTAFLEQSSPLILVERGAGVPIGGVELAPEMAIAVGPEGGWSPDEQAAIQRHSGATAVSLGNLIYRAETAAIVAAGTLIQRAMDNRE